MISLAASPGTWAERAVLPAARTLAIPDTIDDASAAQLLVNPITAWALVNDALPLSDGAWLLQTAAASALGRIVTTLARRRSVRTLNVVRRREHVAQVLAACGDAVICTADESLSSRVRDIVGADGLGAAIDAVGGALGAEVAACLRPGGTMISLGLLGGTTLGPLDAQALIFNATTVRGFWLVDWFARSAPEVINRAFTEIITMLAMGELRLETEAQYDLADFDRALAHASRPARDGKVMFVG